MPAKKTAIHYLRNGGIIAYATEAVYGLGCDPFQEKPVMRLKKIKNRAANKGFILIAADWRQIENLIQPLDDEIRARVFQTWPGPVTWIFPATREAPTWVCDGQTIAIRITAHPIARSLCQQYGGPIVSTSANRADESPIQDMQILQQTFGEEIDYIVPGDLGGALRPTEIRDALTGKIIRQ